MSPFFWWYMRGSSSQQRDTGAPDIARGAQRWVSDTSAASGTGHPTATIRRVRLAA
ncbi:hypothetical protein HMPREF0372_02883 [Flavonifractor plautii ATCC 29863]|uniref:Uncharacterized protein n=1 Tax=Flavonifractor plautii ATCC 29863 TaxID=411475 RepID=G9YTM1_FLAPL|nr:hypothetical protein HMPREF0372_02883 [Flavonifractor plautii ATCC 29863]